MIFQTLRNSSNWLPKHLFLSIAKAFTHSSPKHVFFCVCDHYEPYCKNADAATARKRINKWVELYPKNVEGILDSTGRPFRYSFFYPEEEYRWEDMEVLADFCKAGYGEVEIHLHHHNDTSENLRRTLLDFKQKLHEEHGLLSKNRETGEISYGFIHGNWALDNSRRDECWCGVNDEITILQETGCYADFTLPSAPSETQTRKINSIYYAIDDPTKPKSHDTGIDAQIGKKGEGLLLVQGPLGLNLENRKYGLFPRLENGGLYPAIPITKERISCWFKAGVHLKGRRDVLFIKLYNHGAYEEMINVFLERLGLLKLLELVSEHCLYNNAKLHYVTAREMTNIIISMESESFEFTLDDCNRKYQICY